ncbi:MAG TPA: ComF family protein [Candidatus Kaiserbacteria bacterium]|nr:ComF family protein [Candidatus Kaiserbacteria bacterium]
MFNSLYKTLLDIIFPQNNLERKISNISEEKLSKKLHLSEYNDIVSLFQYKDPLIKQMVWLLKYKKDLHVARLFASALHDFLVEELSDEIMFSGDISGNKKIVLVPIPLSRQRERERGYNQIKLITNEMQKISEFSVYTDLLIKEKDTVPQTSLSKRKDRAKNIKGVFAVQDKGNLKNIHAILIDDVFTTGSTLSEARKMLERAGIYKVSLITLTH